MGGTNGVLFRNTVDGNVWSIDKHLSPTTDSLVDIGSNTVRVRNIYADTYIGNGNLGIVTATEIDLNGDLDVDGHTNLDNVSIAGVSTFSGIVAAGIGSTAITLDNSHKMTFGSAHELEMFHDGSNSYIKQRFFAYPSRLKIISENNGIDIMSGSGGNAHGGYENAISCEINGATKIYHAGVGPYFETYGAGVMFQGSIQVGYDISHHGDTNTRIRFPTNDTISFETAGSERLRIEPSGRLLISNISSRAIANVTAKIQLEGTSGDGSAVSITRNSANANPPYLNFGKSRATSTGGNTIIQNGDNLGEIRFSGADGNDLTNHAASINAEVDGSPSNNVTPGRLIFSTAVGSDPIERLRITSDGKVGINDSSPANQLVVKAPGGSGHTVSAVLSGDASTKMSMQVVQGTEGRLGMNTNHPLALYSGGLERLRITSAGDVGIGYNSPTVKLHVREGVSGASSYDNRYHMICENNGEAYLGFYVPSNSYAGIRFTDNTGLEGYIDYYFNTDEMVYSSTAIHRWTTAGSERLRINSNGSIQITPEGSTSNPYMLIDTSGDSVRFSAQKASGNNEFRFLTQSSGTVAERLRITSGGRIGINNTDPKATLDVRGTAIIADDTGNYPSTYPPADTQLLVYTSTNGQPITNTNCARLCIATDAKQVGPQGYNGAIDFGNSDVTASGSAAQFNWRLASIMSNAEGDTGNDPFGDGNLEFWTKTSNGSLTRRLEIKANGDIAFNNCTSTINSSNYGFYLMNDSDSTKSIYLRHSREANGTHSTAEFHGNQGSMQVYGDGDLRNTNNSYGSLSDENLKQDIVDASSQWDDIKAIKVRKFRFKANPTGDLHLGVVAQELETVSPKLVTEVVTSSDDLSSTETVKAVKYSVLYMKAIKAFQEAQARIETLEAEVAALKGS